MREKARYVCTTCGTRDVFFTTTRDTEAKYDGHEEDVARLEEEQREIARDEGLGWGMGVPSGQVFVDDDYDYY